MLRIGEAAKMFNISNRTLRYWEEQGILSGSRAENGYRFYDDKNTARIKHITMLRKLRMPIADIERIFIANDAGVAIDALTRHMRDLEREGMAVSSHVVLIGTLIRHIGAEKDLTRILSYIESHDSDTVFGKGALQISLSERNSAMMTKQLRDVRIARLPAMTVISYRAESETPEDDCSKVMFQFVTENSLHTKSGFRHFGFNNPNPREDSPVYGYEMWVSVPSNFDVPAPFERKEMPGGLYASIVTYLSDIEERWRVLDNWVSCSDKYACDADRICMEESLDFEAFTAGNDSSMQLDLLIPVRRKIPAASGKK